MVAVNSAQVTATTTLLTTSETVAAVTPLRNCDTVNSPPAEGVLISGIVSGAVGAGTTSIQVRVRQGFNGGVGATAPAGTQVGNPLQVSVTAAGFHGIGFSVQDASAFAFVNPNLQYAVTVQQVGATGNGSVTQAQIGEESCNQFGV